MVATMFGSLIVQARRITPPRRAGGPLAERGEAVGGRRLLPAALVGQPRGRREVVEGDDRVDARLEERLALAGVVVEGGRARTRRRSGSMRLHSSENR